MVDLDSRHKIDWLNYLKNKTVERDSIQAELLEIGNEVYGSL